MKTRTIETLDGRTYEIELDGNDILLMAIDHTLVLHGADLADSENIEIYIDDNFDLAKRIDHKEDAEIMYGSSLFELMNSQPKD